MGRKKQLINRAECIVEAASKLFAHYGYDDTTIDEIANTAGISKGSIYLEFPSKEDILIAVILREKGRQIDELEALAAACTSPVIPELKKILLQHSASIFDAVQRNRRSPETMMLTRDRLRQQMRPFFEARLNILADLLQRAASDGEIAPQANYHQLAELLVKSLKRIFPPYDPALTKSQLLSEANVILEIVLLGLCQLSANWTDTIWV